MSTPLTTSPSPSRIVISPDSPVGRLDMSPLARTQRTYSTEGRSFQPANKHPNALLDATDAKVRIAAQKKLSLGSKDLTDAIATLSAIRLEEGRGSILFSPRPVAATKFFPASAASTSMRFESRSTAEADAAMPAAIVSTKVKKD